MRDLCSMDDPGHALLYEPTRLLWALLLPGFPLPSRPLLPVPSPCFSPLFRLEYWCLWDSAVSAFIPVCTRLCACGFSYHFYTTGSNPVSPFWLLPSSLTAHCGRESYLHALLPSSGRTPAGTSILHSTNIGYSASTVMGVVWPSYLRHSQASSLFRGKCSEISMPLLTAKHVRRMQTRAGLAVLPFETMPLALLDCGTASTVHSLLPTLGVPCRPGTTCCQGWG